MMIDGTATAMPIYGKIVQVICISVICERKQRSKLLVFSIYIIYTHLRPILSVNLHRRKLTHKSFSDENLQCDHGKTKYKVRFYPKKKKNVQNKAQLGCLSVILCEVEVMCSSPLSCTLLLFKLNKMKMASHDSWWWVVTIFNHQQWPCGYRAKS